MFHVKRKDKKTKKKQDTVYDKIMEELMKSHIGTEIIDQVLDVEGLKKEILPKRYRLIALGFLKKDSLEDLNDMLLNNGCQPLYARSSFEATLIFAFANRMTYREWKKMAESCEQIKQERKEDSGPQTYFLNKNITLGELEKYVLSFSEKRDQELVTRQVTHVLDEKIRTMGADSERFLQFYISNLQEFSDVREKTRYYFCKYLYYYMLAKVERYKKTVGHQIPAQEQIWELLPLKAESKLRRRRTDPARLMDVLRECRISPGAIFEEFNYYFFGYVSIDWVDLLLENISDVNELSETQVKMIAGYLRKTGRWDKVISYEEAGDRQIVEEHMNVLRKEEEKPVSRKGENAIRKYLRGDLDIDRTTLICFLLFLGSEETNRNEIIITEERINTILDECGFSMLRKEEAFDGFVLNYIKSPDPVSYLMEEMDRYQERGESFFVYEVYSGSESNAKEIRKNLLFG